MMTGQQRVRRWLAGEGLDCGSTGSAAPRPTVEVVGGIHVSSSASEKIVLARLWGPFWFRTAGVVLSLVGCRGSGLEGLLVVKETPVVSYLQHSDNIRVNG